MPMGLRNRRRIWSLIEDIFNESDGSPERNSNYEKDAQDEFKAATANSPDLRAERTRAIFTKPKPFYVT